MNLEDEMKELQKVSSQIEGDKNNVALRLKRAELLRDIGFQKHSRDYARKALKDSNLAVQLSPQDPQTWLDRGITYYTLDQQDEAIKDYTQSIVVGESSRAYYNRGVALWRKVEKMELVVISPRSEAYQISLKALSDYDKAIDLDKTNIHAYNNRGTIFLSLDDFGRALANFNTCIEIDPQDCVYYYYTGMCLENLEQPRYSNKVNLKNAINSYSKAIEINQDFWPAYYNRAVCYENLSNKGKYGDPDSVQLAITDYDSILRSNPRNEAALYNRGWAYERIGMIDRAIRDYKEFIRFSTDGFTVGQLEVHVEDLVNGRSRPAKQNYVQ